jgi:hypothetical protein
VNSVLHPPPSQRSWTSTFLSGRDQMGHKVTWQTTWAVGLITPKGCMARHASRRVSMSSSSSIDTWQLLVSTLSFALTSHNNQSNSTSTGYCLGGRRRQTGRRAAGGSAIGNTSRCGETPSVFHTSPTLQTPPLSRTSPRARDGPKPATI